MIFDVNSLDSLVIEIQGLLGNTQNVNQLNNRLKQSEDVIRSQAATFASCLTRLDPALHSLAYLYILMGRYLQPSITKDGMVRYLEGSEKYKTCEMIEHIDSSIQRIMKLSKKLTANDEYMSCDPLYLSKVGREREGFDFDDFDGSICSS